MSDRLATIETLISISGRTEDMAKRVRAMADLDFVLALDNWSQHRLLTEILQLQAQMQGIAQDIRDLCERLDT